MNEELQTIHMALQFKLDHLALARFAAAVSAL